MLKAHKPAPGAASALDAAPRTVIALSEAIALIVGVVIGAGIFKAPSLVAGMTGEASWMFAAWALGGLMSLIGALCYAELSTAYAHVGGDYHFLLRAYGRSVSFLFAWARFSVIATGSIALLGFVFGDYMNQLLPLGKAGSALRPACYAALAISALSWLNMRSVKAGARAQAWLTALEVGGLLLVVLAARFLVGNGNGAAAPALAAAPAPLHGSFGEGGQPGGVARLRHGRRMAARKDRNRGRPQDLFVDHQRSEQAGRTGSGGRACRRWKVASARPHRWAGA